MPDIHNFAFSTELFGFPCTFGSFHLHSGGLMAFARVLPLKLIVSPLICLLQASLVKLKLTWRLENQLCRRAELGRQNSSRR